MASNSRSCKNAQQASARLNQPKEASVETTPTPSTVSASSQAAFSALAPALYTKEDLQRITKIFLDFWIFRFSDFETLILELSYSKKILYKFLEYWFFFAVIYLGLKIFN